MQNKRVGAKTNNIPDNNTIDKEYTTTINLLYNNNLNKDI